LPRAVPQKWTGENTIGAKSHFQPKRLYFNDDRDLAVQLWQHFQYGQGQPVAIDLSRLNFSNNITVPKLIPNEVKRLLLQLPVNKKGLEKAYAYKKPTVGGNEKVTHLMLDEPITEVMINIHWRTDFYYFLAFGRLAFNMEDVHLIVNHEKKTVTVSADLVPPRQKDNVHPDTIDKYDFNPDSQRGFLENLTVLVTHEVALPGSTSFFIRRVPASASPFIRSYTFEEFLQ
jgi:hypothetical protein